MKNLLRSVLITLTVCGLFTAPIAAAGNHNAETAVHKGKVYRVAASQGHTTVFAFDEQWQAVFELDKTVSARIFSLHGSLILAIDEQQEVRLLDLESGEMSTITFPDTVTGLTMAPLGDNSIGLLVTMPGAVAWRTLSASSFALLWMEDLPAPQPQYPSIRFGADCYIAWQERPGLKTGIAVAHLAATGFSDPMRFTVRGFDGTARPLLAESDQPVLIWQGSQGRKAAFYMRPVSAAGLGSIKKIDMPEHVSSVLTPQQAIGVEGVITGNGLARGRWSGVRIALNGAGEPPNVQLYSQPDGQMLNPVLVEQAAGEAWVWSQSGQAHEPVLVDARNLSDDPASFPDYSNVQPGDTVYLAFGDSITDGKLFIPETGEKTFGPSYTERLDQLLDTYREPSAVVQSGVSGETTVQGKVRLQENLEEAPVIIDFVLLLQGTNDGNLQAEDGNTIGLISIPNLTEMIASVRDYGATPVLGTMLPRDGGPSMAADQRAAQLSRAMLPAMQLLGVRLAYFHERFPLDDEYIIDEGGRRLHPTTKGYELMAEIWLSALFTFDGDVNRDAMITLGDAQLLLVSLNSRRGSFLFNPDCDINQDGMITWQDLSLIYNSFGTDLLADDQQP